ncbi:hypothetical protein GCM10027085_59310 [Spirosoma aerophilum]
MFNNPCRVTGNNGVSRYVFGNYAARSYNGMPPHPDARGYDHIGANPGFIINHDGQGLYGLLPYGYIYVLIAVIQTRNDHMLGNNYLIADADGANDDAADTHPRMSTNAYIPNTIVDNAVIFYGGVLPQRELTKR